ncbi:hypothetical protein PoB_006054800 [Plakobranchus ocellatus]|uniref:Uncharacterized protein n=1 Tax=Plakobranchus ocellatus TaxID=259542 RepID=A0AAV4CQ63_9GAST|nr:hypothetical protein PoB_006054800 [Plakobranchus ocellatus]
MIRSEISRRFKLWPTSNEKVFIVLTLSMFQAEFSFLKGQKTGLSFMFLASPQQGDLRLSGPPSVQGAGSGSRTRDRRVPADLRADSQATVLQTPPVKKRM